MKTSGERILTTHVGSLPRSKAVTDGVFARENEQDFDPEAVEPCRLPGGRAGRQPVQTVVGADEQAAVRLAHDLQDRSSNRALSTLPVLSLIHISEPTRPELVSRMTSSA